MGGRAVRMLVVFVHPLRESFAAAARDAALRGLRRAGHEVRLRDLYAEGFDPHVSAAERARHRDPWHTKPEIARDVEDLRWAEGITFVYPTWWSGLPSMLKGWLDRTWVDGVVATLPEGATRLHALLTNVRRLVIVTTHGSPWWVNVLTGRSGRRTIFRSIRAMCHWRTRCTWVALYNIDRASHDDRSAFLSRVERRLARLR